MSNFDIVSLIEQNPVTKLSGDYHNKLITKIKATFNDSQQQMFVASFYCYLNCDNKNDFVIDLDNVWKWLGFNQKVKAKILLENHFILNKDYTKSLSHAGKQTMHIKGGHNKQTILYPPFQKVEPNFLCTIFSLSLILKRENDIGYNLSLVQPLRKVDAPSHTTIIRFAPYTVPSSRARGAGVPGGPHYLAIPECSANVPHHTRSRNECGNEK